MEEFQNNMEEEHQEGEADLMYEAHAKVDALIDLLVKKGIINEDEYDSAVEKLLTDLEGDDEDPSCGAEHSEPSAPPGPTEHSAPSEPTPAPSQPTEEKPAESCGGCASQSPGFSGF
tara:strand:- start:2383 stop:2733 length:351 start_codon:yes stop_codon:yes gene_type:complete